MTEETTKVLERVKKMLNLGRDAGATEAERETAMRMAHKLLLKHNLDLATVDASTAAKDDPRAEAIATYYGRPWARVVSHAIARLFFCEYIYVSATNAKDTRHCFIGRESNTGTAIAMSRWLVEAIAKEARKRNEHEGDGDNAWKRSFCIGAAVAVSHRVDRMINEASKAVTAAPGTALVVANLYAVEQATNKALVEKQYPKLGKGRNGKSTGSNEAASAGRAYGNSVNLNQQVTGASSRSRIGFSS